MSKKTPTTQGGGARPGAGRKSKSVSKKILDGQDAKFIVSNMVAEFEGNADMGTADLIPNDMPNPDDYLEREQADIKNPKAGAKENRLKAKEIYAYTYKWLKSVGCAKVVSKGLVERYAMNYARYIDCENAISDFGYIGKHPTTGAPIPSPFVNIGNMYEKQASIAWAQIYQTVKENATDTFMSNPDDDMERLLRG